MIEEESFARPFAFIITRSRTCAARITPVVFRLRMDQRIAVRLARSGQKDPRTRFVSEIESVERAEEARLQRVYRLLLILRRARRTCEMIYLVCRYAKRLSNIVSDERERTVIQKILDILHPSGRHIIKADHIASFTDQIPRQIRSDEACSSGYKYPFAHIIHCCFHFL